MQRVKTTETRSTKLKEYAKRMERLTKVLQLSKAFSSGIRIGKSIYDEIKIDDKIEAYLRIISALEEDASEGELSEEAKEGLKFTRLLLADAEDCKRNPGKKTILCSLCVAGEWAGGAALAMPGVQAGVLAGAAAGPIGCVAGGAVGGIAGGLAGSALGSSAIQNFRADKDGIATEAQMTLVNMKDGAVLPVDGNVYIGKGIEVGARAGVLHIKNERHHLDCVKVGANFGITSKGVDVGAEAKVVWREKENAVQRVGYGFNLDTGVQVDGQTRTFKVLGFGIEKSAEGIGLCTPSGINSYSCVCSTGWTGENCDMDMNDPCASNPCQQGAACSSDNGTYICQCPNGYAGERCQYKTICQPNTCANGGTCSNIFNGEDYYCTCTPLYQGRACMQLQANFTSQDKGCYRLNGNVNDCDNSDMGDQPTVSKCEQKFKDGINSGQNYTYYAVLGKQCSLCEEKPTNQGASWGCNDKCQKSASGQSQLNGYQDSDQICGSTSNGNGHYWQVTPYYEPQQCASMDCSPGVCVDFVGKGECVCPRDRKPSTGKADCNGVKTPCDGNPCGTLGNCTYNLADFSFACTCNDDTMYGQYCNQTHKCTPTNPCQNGGTCVEDPTNGNGYKCECLQYYTDDQCQTPNYCLSNPCQHNGTCEIVKRGLNSTYKCHCQDGWKGSACQTDINECACNPCQNQGTCSQITPPAAPFFTCSCVDGTSGDICQDNPDDCTITMKDGVKYSPCNKTGDTKAQCIDGFNSFHCQCTPEYTGEFCDISMLVWQVMMDIFGSVDGDMLELLNALVSNPSMIKDMVPFILGLESMDNRTSLSWTAAEMFDWAAYEELELNLARDFFSWNDVVLGNCFTFNHRLNPTPYKKRITGLTGGLKVKLRVNSQEYLPWIDTEAITVFVHPPEEYISSESVRYNAPPAIQSSVVPLLTQYKRLGGRYGECVTDPAQVKSFYYYGGYTTDGCIRSCYQDRVFESCGCFDPRFPMPSEAISCDLKKRTCVEAISALGDPSLWPDCHCPLPCSNQLFTVAISRSNYVTEAPACLTETLLKPNCSFWAKDTALVEITDNGQASQIYQETPKLGLNQFIGNLGGLLGVLMGISCITFIEFGFLFFLVGQIMCGKEKPKPPPPPHQNME
ncbi:unnamed protein product, partial [Mesorhabditis spiculigera]